MAMGFLTGGLAPSIASTAAPGDSSPDRTARIPIAVLGDSDSQSYQNLPDTSTSTVARGGKFHATTFQWTESLAKLRGDQLDLGTWGVHGMRGRLALAIEWLGLARFAEAHGWEVRAPIKQDHQFNFAFSGDGCSDFFGGWSRQVPRLVRLMDADPEKWRGGIVVVRIGGNDFANDPTNLGMLSRDPNSPEVRRKMDVCIGVIRKTIDAIQLGHPDTRFVLVGIFNNSNWEKYFDLWRSPQMLANINNGLNYYDNAIRKMVESDKRMAFFDDRKWFNSIWGSRDENGLPNYRVLRLGSNVSVTNTGGDAPSNATLADGHAGLVWNALWACALIDLLNERFALNITPISEDELLRYVVSTGAF